MATPAEQRKKSLKLLRKLGICKDFYEKQAWAQNKLICGVDEVGRGCLAGPVVVCAAILKPGKRINLIKDSKILNAEQRVSVAKKLALNAWYGFGILDQSQITEVNIWHATLRGMKRAVMNLFSTCPELPSKVLVDAMPLNLQNTAYKNIEIHNFPFGEFVSKSIAAASILAKVKRDEMMNRFGAVMPGYEFQSHKGYGTPKHQEALKLNGQSILHRQNFLKKYEVRELDEEWSHGTIFR